MEIGYTFPIELRYRTLLVHEVYQSNFLLDFELCGAWLASFTGFTGSRFAIIGSIRSNEMLDLHTDF
jgi:hypothetical protein